MSEDYLHPHHPTAVPYTDNSGEVVTLTREQVQAVWHAVRQWSKVCHEEGSSQASAAHPEHLFINMSKSRALGRLLVDGRPLFAEKPPPAWGAADYPRWDGENSAASLRVGRQGQDAT